jgi:hypothetical protein
MIAGAGAGRIRGDGSDRSARAGARAPLVQTIPTRDHPNVLMSNDTTIGDWRRSCGERTRNTMLTAVQLHGQLPTAITQQLQICRDGLPVRRRGSGGYKLSGALAATRATCRLTPRVSRLKPWSQIRSRGVSPRVRAFATRGETPRRRWARRPGADATQARTVMAVDTTGCRSRAVPRGVDTKLGMSHHRR